MRQMSVESIRWRVLVGSGVGASRPSDLYTAFITSTGISHRFHMRRGVHLRLGSTAQGRGTLSIQRGLPWNTSTLRVQCSRWRAAPSASQLYNGPGYSRSLGGTTEATFASAPSGATLPVAIAPWSLWTTIDECLANSSPSGKPVKAADIADAELARGSSTDR
jgi:hypothetical protein